MRNKFNHVKCELQIIFNFIDFAHIRFLFLISNDQSLEKHDKTQQKKFSELLNEYLPRNDRQKVIFNFSKGTTSRKLSSTSEYLRGCLKSDLSSMNPMTMNLLVLRVTESVYKISLC